MQTVVLAAGKGTRMRPLTSTRPKPMLPVANRPLLLHILRTAVTAGATRFVIVVGYRGEMIRDWFGAAFNGAPISYVEQTDLTGTASAVQAAVTVLEDAPFVVLNGDALYDVDGLDELYGLDAGIGAATVADPRPYGVLETTGSQVTGVIEKPSDPPSNFINTGAYVFPADSTKLLDVACSDRGEYEITDVVSEVCQRHRVGYVEFARWLDVGRPWELLAANEWKVPELDRSVGGKVHERAEVKGTVVIESGAEIRAGVTIEGPVVIGENATIGPNAYIRGTSVIGPGSTVGHGVEIKNSVLLGECAVPHLSYVGDSILGEGVNLGAGTIVANLRHDDEPIRMTVKGERVSTGRRKFGVVVGDHVKTGINTSINAGVKVSPHARTKPGESVTRDR